MATLVSWDSCSINVFAIGCKLLCDASSCAPVSASCVLPERHGLNQPWTCAAKNQNAAGPAAGGGIGSYAYGEARVFFGC